MNFSLNQVKERFAELIRLNPEDQKIYLVGGVVRDLVLERVNKDIDVLCELETRSIAHKLAEAKKGAYFVLDEERNTCRVITTDSGVKRIYDFARQQGNSLIEDLKARDFTINAMAVDLDAPDVLIDPLHGSDDLKNGILRVCSPDSFQSDPVRVIRALRYSLAYQLKIDPETMILLKDSVPALQSISGERKRDEIFKILDLPDPTPALVLLQETGIFTELGMSELTSSDFDLSKQLALLLNTIGDQHQIQPDESISGFEDLSEYFSRYQQLLGKKNSSDRNLRQLLFLNSILESSDFDTAKQIVQSLMLSNEEVERVLVTQKYIGELPGAGDRIKSISDRDLYLLINKTDEASLDICLLVLSRKIADLSQEKNKEELKLFLGLTRKIFEAWFDRQNVMKPVPFLNGNDLMMIFDVSAGPLIGKLLEKLKEEQAAGTITNHEQALEWMEEQVNKDFDQRHWNRGKA